MPMPIIGETSLYKVVDSLRQLWQLVQNIPAAVAVLQGQMATIQAAWTAWTPTYAGSTSGTPVVTTTSARFQQIGKTVHFHLDATITNVGTAVGNFMTFTLPAAPLTPGSQIAMGREIATAGLVVAAQGVGPLTIVGEGAGGTNTLVVNYRFVINGTYEAT